jgi:acyl dehydratase
MWNNMKIEDLKVGDTLTTKSYTTITQDKIQKFADATGDRQWIHLDTERCLKQSPFKTTIAHGFLSVSLMPESFAHCIKIDASKTTMINYGMDNLRFIEAVRVNDEIKYSFTLESIEQKESGSLYKFNGQVDIKNRTKPALAGSFLSLIL